MGTCPTITVCVWRTLLYFSLCVQSIQMINFCTLMYGPGVFVITPNHYYTLV